MGGQSEQDQDWSQRVRGLEERWQAKPALRAVYARWFARMRARCAPGPTMEVGGGGGQLKAQWPGLISSDVIFAPWLEVVADAGRLPVKDASLANVVGIDVLHHLADLDAALADMTRALRPGGRLVFIEPFASPFSRLVRGLFHHERQDLSQEKIFTDGKAPDEGNLAAPTLVFWRGRSELARRFPGLKLVEMRLGDPVVYPLTGGYGHKSLLPQGLLLILHKLEPALAPLNRLAAFKLLVVLERV